MHAGIGPAYVLDAAPLTSNDSLHHGSYTVGNKEMAATGGLPGETPPDEGKEGYFYCPHCGDGPIGKWQNTCPSCHKVCKR